MLLIFHCGLLLTVTYYNAGDLFKIHAKNNLPISKSFKNLYLVAKSNVTDNGAEDNNGDHLSSELVSEENPDSKDNDHSGNSNENSVGMLQQGMQVKIPKNWPIEKHSTEIVQIPNINSPPLLEFLVVCIHVLSVPSYTFMALNTHGGILHISQ